MCHNSCIAFGERNLSKQNIEGKSVIEVGSKNVNGSLRPFIETLNPKQYIGTDIETGIGVDVICDAENLVQTFGKESFDVVISTELLEHVKNWKSVISNIKNIAKPNGIILITTRSSGFPKHNFPSDYWRYEIDDMKHIFSDCIIETLEKDPETPGVFIKVRKPSFLQYPWYFIENNLTNYEINSVNSTKYSIVIPTYGENGINLTDTLLESISNFNNLNLDEIIISEDGSNLDSMLKLHHLKEKYNLKFRFRQSNIILVFNPLYQSFSKTVNSGIMNSNPNNDILLLNNDMIALTSFESFVDFKTNKEKVGIIGAKLLYPDGTIQHAGMVRQKYSDRFLHIYSHEDQNFSPTNYPRKYVSVTGACFYIDRNLINTIGLLDENYKMSFEDVDYCINAQLNGFKVWYNPDVKMVHFEKETRKNDTNEVYNRQLFWSKWYSLYDQIDPNIKTEERNAAIVVTAGFLGIIYLASRKSNKPTPSKP